MIAILLAAFLWAPPDPNCWPGAIYCPPPGTPPDTSVCYYRDGAWRSDYTPDGLCAFGKGQT